MSVETVRNLGSSLPILGVCLGHQAVGAAYGANVVEPAPPPPYAFDPEHVVLLSDWTDLDPAALMRPQ